MKPLLIAAAVLLAVPAAAQAQVAAGSVPNTFDDPAARAQAAQQTRPAPAPAPAQPAISAEPADAASGEVLRDIIAEIQAGELDYSRMTDTLAAAVREQESVVTPLVQGFGALITADFVGSRDDIDIFNVTFANAATQWLIGINPEGKVSALLFRPGEE